MKKQTNTVPYDYGTGRRKTSSARVFLRPGDGKMTVNKRPLEAFFSRLRSQIVARNALKLTDNEKSFDVLVTVRGGGESSQAAAVQHGIARALVAHNPDYKPTLKAAGVITRDPRAVERKKPGLRKARRSRQYSKR